MKNVYSIKTGLPLTEKEVEVVTKRDLINKLIEAEELLKLMNLPTIAAHVGLAVDKIIEPMTEEEFNKVI